jgi:hypothetical protein
VFTVERPPDLPGDESEGVTDDRSNAFTFLALGFVRSREGFVVLRAGVEVFVEEEETVRSGLGVGTERLMVFGFVVRAYLSEAIVPKKSILRDTTSMRVADWYYEVGYIRMGMSPLLYVVEMLGMSEDPFHLVNRPRQGFPFIFPPLPSC